MNTGIIYEPTNNLRFVEREGKKVLQQAWRPIEHYRDPKAKQPMPEWRDVELVQPGSASGEHA